MVHVTRVALADPCGDCAGILLLHLSTGQAISPDEAHRWILAGAVLRSGSETGPVLHAASRGPARYVRTREMDSPGDPLLRLPRRL